jgi:hypothetical protein
VKWLFTILPDVISHTTNNRKIKGIDPCSGLEFRGKLVWLTPQALTYPSSGEWRNSDMSKLLSS